MDTVKKVGEFTFSHIGNGLYKADAACVCDSLSVFEAMNNGGDLFVILVRDTGTVSIEVICDANDDSACAAMHRYLEDNYTNVGIPAGVGITHVYPEVFLGGIYLD